MTSIRNPIADAAVVTSLICASVTGKVGLTSRPTCAAAGIAACEPIESGHHQHVAGFEAFDHLGQLGRSVFTPLIFSE
jgi:hypothetical protein